MRYIYDSPLFCFEIISYTPLFLAICNNNGKQDSGETGIDCGGGEHFTGCPDCGMVKNKYCYYHYHNHHIEFNRVKYVNIE